MDINKRLKELGIELPVAPVPTASYVPFLLAGEFLFIAGQVPVLQGEVHYAGRLGETLSLEQGVAAARMCGINILTQVSEALDGDLNRVIGCVRLGGFVHATPGFTDHPKVVNGASDLMIEVFGDKGKHTRVAVGVASLPRGVGVEIDAIFRVR